MNINISPPRKGFFVIPDSNLRCISIKMLNDVIETSPEKIERNIKIAPDIFSFQNNDDKSIEKHSDLIPVFHRNVKNRIKTKKNTKLHQQQSSAKRSQFEYPTKEKTRVQFQTNENNDVVSNIVEANHFLTREDISLNWWSKKDLMAMKERANDVCRFYINIRPDYRVSLIRMLIRCGAQKTEELPELENAIESTETEEDEDLSTLVDCDARGIEKKIIVSMNLPFHRHKRSINVVLDTQTRLRAIDQSYFTIDQKVRLIAAQYSLNSKYAGEWARKIAYGDARGVSQNFKFDL